MTIDQNYPMTIADCSWTSYTYPFFFVSISAISVHSFRSPILIMKLWHNYSQIKEICWIDSYRSILGFINMFLYLQYDFDIIASIETKRIVGKLLNDLDHNSLWNWPNSDWYGFQILIPDSPQAGTEAAAEQATAQSILHILELVSEKAPAYLTEVNANQQTTLSFRVTEESSTLAEPHNFLLKLSASISYFKAWKHSSRSYKKSPYARTHEEQSEARKKSPTI